MDRIFFNLYAHILYIHVNIYELQALLTAHDDIVDRNYEELPDVAPQMIQEQPPVFSNVNDQIRLVGIMKSDTEPLVNFFLSRKHISGPGGRVARSADILLLCLTIQQRC